MCIQVLNPYSEFNLSFSTVSNNNIVPTSIVRTTQETEFVEQDDILSAMPLTEDSFLPKLEAALFDSQSVETNSHQHNDLFNLLRRLTAS